MKDILSFKKKAVKDKPASQINWDNNRSFSKRKGIQGFDSSYTQIMSIS